LKQQAGDSRASYLSQSVDYMKEISESRWHRAQEYEKRWWTNLSFKSLPDYKSEADYIKSRLKPFLEINDSTKILQVGCGPIDVINYWRPGVKYAIDPLTEFYRSRGLLKEGKDIRYFNCTVEDLPLPDNYFDIIIMNNVLDHVYSPWRTISQVRDKLSEKGVLYTRTNVRPRYLMPLLKFFSVLEIDTFKGHPHLFTEEELRRTISERLVIMEEWTSKSGYNTSQPRFRGLIQHIIEYQHTLICRK